MKRDERYDSMPESDGEPYHEVLESLLKTVRRGSNPKVNGLDWVECQDFTRRLDEADKRRGRKKRR